MKHACLCSCFDKALVEEILDRASELGHDPCRLIALLLESYACGFSHSEQTVTGQGHDRRRHPRRRMVLPAVLRVRRYRSGPGIKSVTLEDLSLGGVKLSFVRDKRFNCSLMYTPLKCEVMFKIGKEPAPVVIDCQGMRIEESGQGMTMGLRLTGTDFSHFRAIAEHLALSEAQNPAPMKP